MNSRNALLLAALACAQQLRAGTLTFSNTGAVVSDATTQALTSANIRGAQGVHSLWRIGGAVGSLTVNVLIEASDAGSGAWQPADVYFGRGQTILLERERIKQDTIRQRRLNHQAKAA